MSYRIRKGTKEDSAQVHQLICELAIFEKAEAEMTLSVQQLMEDGFGENPAYGIFVAEDGETIVGIALYYEKYSTWKGRCLYLEDLVVTESYRGKGAGKSLFEAVIQEAKERSSGRMEWQVLDWNQGAIDFYKSYGALLDETWLNGRFSQEKLREMKFINESI